MSRDYKVARKDVYAGRLERNGNIIRSILFTPDVDDKAIDLIYDTPMTYDVVENLDKYCISDDLVVTNFISLNSILEDLGYYGYLKQKDLNQIHRRYIVDDNWMFSYKRYIDFLYNRMLISKEERDQRQAKLDNIIRNLAGINLIGNGKPTIEEPGHSLTFKRR